MEIEKPTKGDILKRLVRQKGIKTQELADALNCSKSVIFKYYKKNNFNTKLLEKMAEVWGVAIMVFFDKKHTNENSFHATGVLNTAGNGNNISGNTINGNVYIALPKEGYKKVTNAGKTQTTIEIATSLTDTTNPRTRTKTCRERGNYYPTSACYKVSG